MSFHNKINENLTNAAATNNSQTAGVEDTAKQLVIRKIRRFLKTYPKTRHAYNSEALFLDLGSFVAKRSRAKDVMENSFVVPFDEVSCVYDTHMGVSLFTDKELEPPIRVHSFEPNSPWERVYIFNRIWMEADAEHLYIGANIYCPRKQNNRREGYYWLTEKEISLETLQKLCDWLIKTYTTNENLTATAATSNNVMKGSELFISEDDIYELIKREGDEIDSYYHDWELDNFYPKSADIFDVLKDEAIFVGKKYFVSDIHFSEGENKDFTTNLAVHLSSYEDNDDGTIGMLDNEVSMDLSVFKKKYPQQYVRLMEYLSKQFLNENLTNAAATAHSDIEDKNILSNLSKKELIDLINKFILDHGFMELYKGSPFMDADEAYYYIPKKPIRFYFDYKVRSSHNEHTMFFDMPIQLFRYIPKGFNKSDFWWLDSDRQDREKIGGREFVGMWAMSETFDMKDEKDTKRFFIEIYNALCADLKMNENLTNAAATAQISVEDEADIEKTVIDPSIITHIKRICELTKRKYISEFSSNVCEYRMFKNYNVCDNKKPVKLDMPQSLFANEDEVDTEGKEIYLGDFELREMLDSDEVQILTSIDCPEIYRGSQGRGRVPIDCVFDAALSLEKEYSMVGWSLFAVDAEHNKNMDNKGLRMFLKKAMLEKLKSLLAIAEEYADKDVNENLTNAAATDSLGKTKGGEISDLLSLDEIVEKIDELIIHNGEKRKETFFTHSGEETVFYYTFDEPLVIDFEAKSLLHQNLLSFSPIEKLRVVAEGNHKGHFAWFAPDVVDIYRGEKGKWITLDSYRMYGEGLKPFLMKIYRGLNNVCSVNENLTNAAATAQSDTKETADGTFTKDLDILYMKKIKGLAELMVSQKSKDFDVYVQKDDWYNSWIQYDVRLNEGGEYYSTKMKLTSDFFKPLDKIKYYGAEENEEKFRRQIARKISLACKKEWIYITNVVIKQYSKESGYANEGLSVGIETRGRKRISHPKSYCERFPNEPKSYFDFVEFDELYGYALNLEGARSNNGWMIDYLTPSRSYDNYDLRLKILKYIYETMSRICRKNGLNENLTNTAATIQNDLNSNADNEILRKGYVGRILNCIKNNPKTIDVDSNETGHDCGTTDALYSRLSIDKKKKLNKRSDWEMYPPNENCLCAPSEVYGMDFMFGTNFWFEEDVSQPKKGYIHYPQDYVFLIDRLIYRYDTNKLYFRGVELLPNFKTANKKRYGVRDGKDWGASRWWTEDEMSEEDLLRVTEFLEKGSVNENLTATAATQQDDDEELLTVSLDQRIEYVVNQIMTNTAKLLKVPRREAYDKYHFILKDCLDGSDEIIFCDEIPYKLSRDMFIDDDSVARRFIGHKTKKRVVERKIAALENVSADECWILGVRVRYVLGKPTIYFVPKIKEYTPNPIYGDKKFPNAPKFSTHFETIDAKYGRDFFKLEGLWGSYGIEGWLLYSSDWNEPKDNMKEICIETMQLINTKLKELVEKCGL